MSIRHSAGSTEAAKTVLCAGPWADRLAVAAGADPDPRVVPFRGAYLRLKPARADLVRASIYPVPDPELPFLGMHLTRGPDGEVLLGPTALLVGARDAYRLGRVVPRDLRESLTWPGTGRMMRRHWRAGLTELSHAVSIALVRRRVPAVRARVAARGRRAFRPLGGVRAQAIARDGSLIDDFVVSETERGDPRPQRPLPRRHLVAGARRADRRPPRRDRLRA